MIFTGNKNLKHTKIYIHFMYKIVIAMNRKAKVTPMLRSRVGTRSVSVTPLPIAARGCGTRIHLGRGGTGFLA